VTRFFPLLALLLLAPGSLAEDDVPLIFFRQPDRRTKKDIVHAVSSKGLGSTRAVRRQSRARLVEIGPWAVPFLAEALTRGTENARVRMNAAITMAWIRDPAAVVPLGAGAEKDKDLYVRWASCLALGKFRESGAVIRILKSRRGGLVLVKTKMAAALALGKSRDLPAARMEIRAAAADMPKDPHYAAAILVATSLLVEDPQILDRFLGHKDKLLRRTAVTCRLVRPLKPTQVEILKKRLAVERDRDIRALLYHALGAVEGATDLRGRLLEAATQTKEKKPARIAAAIELARRYNVPANYEPLLRALRKIQSRNDPVAGPLIFALAQTGHPEAIEKVKKIMKAPGEGLRSFYAAGSLLYLACHGLANEMKARTLIDEIAGTATTERRHKELLAVVKPLRYEMPAVLWEKALTAEKGKSLRKLFGAWIWILSDEERAWAKLNLLLPFILELDDVMDTHDMSEHASAEPPKGQGATDDSGGDGDTHDVDGGNGDEGGVQPGVGRPSAAGKPEEQDLIDFLRDPYYVREDLRGG
jgi:HEAT repeat protein